MKTGRYVFKKNAKGKLSILSLILIALMWIFWGFNTSNADYETYKLIYKGYYPNHEKGFIFLCNFFYGLQIDYENFLKIISIVILLFFFLCVRKYTKNVTYTLLLFFVFPFFLNCVQYRSFISLVIVLWAVQYLLEDKVGNTFKYVLYIFLASLFHYSAFFYFVLLFSKLNIKRIHMFASVAVAICIAVILTRTELASVITQILFDSQKANEVMTQRARFGFVTVWFWQMFGFLLFYKIHKRSLLYVGKTESYCLRKKTLQRLYNVQTWMFLLYPFYMFTASFFRLYQLSIILIYISAGNLYLADRKDAKNMRIVLLVFFYALLLGIQRCFGNGIAASIVTNNSILIN